MGMTPTEFKKTCIKKWNIYQNKYWQI
jgi:hypothetical protein